MTEPPIVNRSDQVMVTASLRCGLRRC